MRVLVPSSSSTSLTDSHNLQAEGKRRDPPSRPRFTSGETKAQTFSGAAEPPGARRARGRGRPEGSPPGAAGAKCSDSSAGSLAKRPRSPGGSPRAPEPPPPGRPPLRGQGIPGSRAVSPLPRRELSGAPAHSTAGLGRRGRSHLSGEDCGARPGAGAPRAPPGGGICGAGAGRAPSRGARGGDAGSGGRGRAGLPDHRGGEEPGVSAGRVGKGRRERGG